MLASLSEALSRPGSLKPQPQCVQTQGSTLIPMLECSTWNIFKKNPPKRRSFTLSSPTNTSLSMDHHALHAPIPIFQRSSNVPRGTFSKEDHTFSLLASSPEPSLCASHLLNQQATRCPDSRINSYSNARIFHVEHFQKKAI